MPNKPPVIALEEHYLDPEVAKHFTGLDAVPARGSGGAAGLPMVARRLYDLEELRLKEMDEAGIDIQVLSHAAPSLQKFDAETAVRLAQGVNDRLHRTVQAHPDRFAAFAAALTLSFAALIFILASYLASSMLSLWARIFFSMLSFTVWIRIFTLSDSAVMSAFSNRSRFLPVTAVFAAVSAS